MDKLISLIIQYVELSLSIYNPNKPNKSATANGLKATENIKKDQATHHLTFIIKLAIEYCLYIKQIDLIYDRIISI